MFETRNGKHFSRRPWNRAGSKFEKGRPGEMTREYKGSLENRKLRIVKREIELEATEVIEGPTVETEEEAGNENDIDSTGYFEDYRDEFEEEPDILPECI